MTDDGPIKELKLRTCRTCKKVKSESEFYARKQRKDGLDTRCSSCSKRDYRKRYQKNKNKFRKQKKKRRRRNQRLRWKYLSSNPCVDCGEDDPVVLVFDHVGPREKRANVSDLVYRTASVKSIVNEISKCEVRCANCHARRHHMERVELQEASEYVPWQDD